jgi:TonB-linked SusC/RagA family outer membrane protein
MRRTLPPRALSAIVATLFTVSTSLGAQQGRTTISGTVTDEATGQPIVGATVSVFGTPYAASSNDQGRYSIVNVPSGQIIAVDVRRLGFGQVRKDNLRLNAPTLTLDFKMSSAPLALEAITSSATVDPTSGIKAPYAVSHLTAEQMPVPAIGSASQMLAGKVAGVTALRASGEPGEGSFVQIRAPLSPFHTNGPLYVIDGVALSDANASFTGTQTMDFDAQDIESIEVIRGAAAAALYGSRGANGVISIKTNRGKNVQLGRSQLTSRTQALIGQFTNDIPKLNHHYYKVNAQQQWVDANNVPVPRSNRIADPDGMIDNTYTQTFDNVGQVFRSDRAYIGALSLAQSSATTNMNLSFDENYQRGGNIVARPFVRTNVRATVDHSFRDNLTTAITLLHARTRQNPDQLSYTDLWRTDPDVNLLAPNSDGSPYRIYADSANTTLNPLYRQYYRENESRNIRTLLNTSATFRPFSFLSLTGDFSYDRKDRINDNYTPPGLANDNNGGLTLGTLTYQENEGDLLQSALGATLLRDFNGLTLRLTGKGEMAREKALQFQAQGTNFAYVGLKDLAGAATKTNTSATSDIRTQSGTLALGADYNGKYIADLLFRREGSSLFGPDHRFTNYYRLGASYVMSSENWYSKLPSFVQDFTTMKLYTNFGTAGNRPAFADQYPVLLVRQAGLVRDVIGSPFIQPEIRTDHEYGLDLIYKSRLSFQLAYSQSTADNTLVEVAVPSATGFNTAWKNVGKAQGRTWEGTVEGTWLQRKNFRWSSNLVLDQSKEKQLVYNRPCYIDGVRWRCDGISLTSMWGRKLARTTSDLPTDAATQAAVGQFQVNDEGYLVWVGAGNKWSDGLAKNLWNTVSPRINGVQYRWGEPFQRPVPGGTAESEFIGDGQPKFHYGFGNTVVIKGVRIYGLVRGQVGGQIYNVLRHNTTTSADWYELDQTGRPDSLKKPYYYYTRSLAQSGNNYVDAFVEPGSWLKFSEFLVSYSWGQQQLGLLRKIGADRLNLELTGRDLYTWSRFRGADPEAGISSAITAVGNAAYPLQRSLTTGITLVF